MTLYDYFFTPHGRIGRSEYWIGMLVLVALSTGVSMLIDPAAFSSVPADQGVKLRAKGAVTAPSLAGTIWNLALVWPSTAIAIKRFNDRDWPDTIGYALGAAMAALVIANYFGFLLDPEHMSAGEKLVLLGLVVAFFWSIFENGFQAGTSGPNRHGADPLVKSHRRD